MKVTYKTYKPDTGFDEILAEIYNSVVKRYECPTTTSEEVRNRISDDKFDQEGIRFAFEEDDKPLAYIRYHYYPTGSLYIGCPWSTGECPEKIQDVLFEDLLVYLKEKFPETKELFMGYFDDRIKFASEFAQRKGLEKADSYHKFLLDVNTLNTMDLSANIEGRVATQDDINILVQVALNDEFLGKAMSEEQLQNYFESKVLKDGNCIIISTKDGEAIASTAPLRDFQPDITLIRFTAIKQGFETYRRDLYIKLAKTMVSQNLTDQRLAITAGERQTGVLTVMKQLEAIEDGSSSRYRIQI